MSSEARTVTEKNAAELAVWCGGRLVKEVDAIDSTKSSPGINVPVRDGVGRARVGDMLIRTSDGKFVIIKNEF